MKKVFVISWYYPPINSSEGLVTYKLINNSEYEYDVFTQKNNKNWSYGKNVEYENNNNVNSIFSKSDNIQGWITETLEYFEKNYKKYDIIMTRSMPEESHVIGKMIKEKFPNIKWIASFGDPIKNNPYIHINYVRYPYFSKENMINRNMSKRYYLSPKRIAQATVWKLRHKYDIEIRNKINKIEESTLEMCDAIILNNESQKKHMLGENKTLNEKAYVIPHSYSKKLYPKKNKEFNKKIKFVFIGHLDELRNATPLLKAIKLLKESIDNLEEKVEFCFYGNMGNDDKLFILNNYLLDIVKLKKSVSYSDSLRIMQEADWLLHFDGNISLAVDENIFFAAKIADYFGSKTKIIAITMQEGAVNNILHKANALTLSYSAEEIKNYLYLIIEKKYNINMNEKFIEQFESKKVARNFDKIIKDIREQGR